MRYQALSVPPALGALNVWLIELSPFVGEVPPTRPEYVPEWLAAFEAVALPTTVQPVKVPVSKPPLVIPPPPPPDEVTVRDTVVLWVALVPVPVMVSVEVPAAAVPALTVSVDEPPEETLVGLNEAVAPDGTPLTEKLTVCAEPLVIVVLIVEVPVDPCATLSDDGLAEIEKSLGGGALITKVTVVLCVALAPVPVTVMA
jgi:hypothetical protein